MLIKEILDATKGTLLSGNIDDIVSSFSNDTRSLNDGACFVCLKGIRDGHDFITDAIIKGAKTVIVSKKIERNDINVILVEDTLEALKDLARYKRDNFKGKVVAVTGSVGKTSTKDMISSVISTKYKTLKTEGNFNNHIGLPLTLLRTNDEEVLVLEMGMNHLKEIDELTNIAKPNISVITNIGTAHIGELGSRENIFKAKMEIVNGLVDDKILVVNNDDEYLKTLRDNKSYKIITIGIDNTSTFQAFAINLNDESSTFKLIYDSKEYLVLVPFPGLHFIRNALISIAVGITLDIPMEKCIEGIRDATLTKKRGDIYTLKDNIKLLDGSYNANLDSMKSSIDVLSKFEGRKIAVLGDMLELGNFSEEIHREVGKYLKEKGINEILTVGKKSKYICDENKEKSINFDTLEELEEYLFKIVKPNDVILVKASNSMNLSVIANRLKEVLK